MVWVMMTSAMLVVLFSLSCPMTFRVRAVNQSGESIYRWNVFVNGRELPPQSRRAKVNADECNGNSPLARVTCDTL